MTLQERLAATNFKGPGFDQIRVAAAVVVLLYHSRGVGPGDIRDDALFAYSGGFVQFGLLAVLVFFSLSGFLVTPGLVRRGDVISYLTHRGLRIFPALATVVLVTMFALGPALTTLPLRSYFTDPHFFLYAKNALTLSIRYLPGVVGSDGQPLIVNGALWTLYFEILSYLILAWLGVVRLLRPVAFLALYAAAYALYVAINSYPRAAAWAPERLVILDSLFVYFAAGAALYVFAGRIPYSKPLALAAAAAAVVALPLGLGPLLLPICLPYAVLVAGLSDLPGGSLIRRDLSYGLYLIHAPILTALIVVFPSLKTWWPAAGITLLTATGLAWLSWTFVEAPILARKHDVSRWIHARIDALRAAWPRPEKAPATLSD